MQLKPEAGESLPCKRPAIPPYRKPTRLAAVYTCIGHGKRIVSNLRSGNIGQENPFPAHLLYQRLNLGVLELDDLLLPAVDPAGQDQEEELPRVEDEIHGSPVCHCRISLEIGLADGLRSEDGGRRKSRSIGYLQGD
jgi:hypothetical protein